MSPKSRQKKKYYSDKLVNYVKSFHLGEKMERELVMSAIKALNLSDLLNCKPKSKKVNDGRGRPMTNYTTRKTVWNFWHDHSTESSDSTRPAKLRQSGRNKIQSGLQLSPSVKPVLQRGKIFYESMWRITHHSFQVLYEKCCALHPDHMVSSGTFWDLKPFYVHGASARYMLLQNSSSCKKDGPSLVKLFEET